QGEGPRGGGGGGRVVRPDRPAGEGRGDPSRVAPGRPPLPASGRAMTDVPRLLAAADRGDKRAAAELLPLVYTELRRLAAAKMAGEKPGQTLNPTPLLHAP